MKKKVSFDIEEKDLSDIKKYCEINSLKLSDFFRSGAIEKLERDKDHVVIFLAIDGKVEKHVVDKRLYEIDLFDACDEMKINVGATKEGTIRLKNGLNIDEPIAKLISQSPDKKLLFFSRQ